jgi:hypothetical protein
MCVPAVFSAAGGRTTTTEALAVFAKSTMKEAPEGGMGRDGDPLTRRVRWAAASSQVIGVRVIIGTTRNPFTTLPGSLPDRANGAL